MNTESSQIEFKQWLKDCVVDARDNLHLSTELILWGLMEVAMQLTIIIANNISLHWRKK